MKYRNYTCSSCGATKQVPLSSKFNGVSLYKPNGKYRTRVTVHGNTVSLGYFTDEVNAAVAYDEYVLANGLIDKPLNFPHGRLQ